MSLSGLNQEETDLRQLIEAETQKQRFQNLVHGLTEQCWEVCVTGKPSTRLEPRTESCLSNCVERFIDTTNFIVNRLGKTNKFSSSSELFPDS